MDILQLICVVGAAVFVVRTGIDLVRRRDVLFALRDLILAAIWVCAAWFIGTGPAQQGLVVVVGGVLLVLLAVVAVLTVRREHGQARQTS